MKQAQIDKYLIKKKKANSNEFAFFISNCLICVKTNILKIYFPHSLGLQFQDCSVSNSSSETYFFSTAFSIKFS